METKKMINFLNLNYLKLWYFSVENPLEQKKIRKNYKILKLTKLEKWKNLNPNFKKPKKFQICYNLLEI